MSALNQAHANNLIDGSLGTAAFTATVGPLKCRLMTANGTGTSAGTEVSGGSYTAQTVTFSAATGGSALNSATLNFTGMPQTTIVGIELWDSAGSPARKWYGALSGPKGTSAGDTFQISAGALTATLG